MSQLNVDLALVKKYNVPGPRYTSYPPANQFTSEFTWPALAEEILQNNRADRDLSLYFHIPFCQSLCWYCGCTTVITTDSKVGAGYLEYLRKETQLMSLLLSPKRKAVQLHFGGGTPTFLAPDELRKLGALIHENFNIAPDAEAGVELDPRRLTRDHVHALREIGFNRASIGVQDHNPVVQKAVHRMQPFAQTKMAVDWIRAAGFTSLNLDLIYGLPHQTAASFEKTLDEALRLKPDRFAVFNYAHVPWVKPAQKALTETALPAPEEKLQILKITIEKLTAAGFVYIGMDHFARADDELAIAQRQKTLQRNFQGYSTRDGVDIYGFGMSAISQTDGAYWQNRKELPLYYAALDAGQIPVAKAYFPTEEDKLRRQTIMRLMCDLSLDYRAMSARLGVEFAEHFSTELDSLADFVADGLVRLTETGLEITPAGRLFIRNIAMRFDAYQTRQLERRFSQTV